MRSDDALLLALHAWMLLALAALIVLAETRYPHFMPWVVICAVPVAVVFIRWLP